MSVLEIEAAISKLSPDQIDELMSRLENHYSKIWDQQIEEDLESGRLDDLPAEVDKEIEAGLGRPL